MRPSASVWRVPRRLAGEVLRSATQNVKGSETPFVDELPLVLRRFWEKFPPAPFREYAEGPTATNAADANPFLANKHPVTGSWHSPKYSMRQQADIYKAAYRFGVEHLLPKLLHGRSFYEAKYASSEGPKGAKLFKLTQRERDAPRRKQEVADALAKVDDLLVSRKGKRFERFLEHKKKARLV